MLAAAGHDVLDVRDAGLRGQPDMVVQSRAFAEGRVLVAADLDFANALRFPPGSHPGIVILRVPDDWGSRARAERLMAGLEETGAARIQGAIVIIEPARTRVFTATTA